MYHQHNTSVIFIPDAKHTQRPQNKNSIHARLNGQSPVSLGSNNTTGATQLLPAPLLPCNSFQATLALSCSPMVQVP
eukprot:CAMPEP_0174289052 /NCGR_PEP_ID=MMETSP0809-20121228/23425_1 /TAXON_ID=73025 ORGANISM="Eutreptiella gymnastica-like, Strain CCMP1594" /NCGR_SAMPLE_ID=MMETSP0809 /ASSEMBLY_ACC=CAM_ASM_000658 /LENGTH=76 /DNA_ID=CAMNT_0015386743 /DNA_START=56 /DNA_END=282 /DNA_ORIENTATION=+